MENKLGKYLTTAFVVALAALAIVRLGDFRKGPPVSRHASRIMMDTVVSLQIYDSDAQLVDRAVEAAFAEMKRLEHLLSCWIPGSDVDKINDSAGLGMVSVDHETWHVIQSTEKISRLTGGSFDITIGAVMRLWDFQTEQPQVPDTAAIQRGLQLMGMQRILLDSTGFRVGLEGRGAAIDLGGAAKGYAVDKAMEILRNSGVKTAVVDAGGDIGLLGRKPHGQSWKIGIKDPGNPEEIIEVIEVDSGAVATSGSYERYFIQDGVRYHHILDPATGMPAGGVASATILANTALEADILSTAVFVLGPEKGITLIEQLAGVEGIIYKEGPKGFRRLASSGLVPNE